MSTNKEHKVVDVDADDDDDELFIGDLEDVEELYRTDENSSVAQKSNDDGGEGESSYTLDSNELEIMVASTALAFRASEDSKQLTKQQIVEYAMDVFYPEHRPQQDEHWTSPFYIFLTDVNKVKNGIKALASDGYIYSVDENEEVFCFLDDDDTIPNLLESFFSKFDAEAQGENNNNSNEDDGDQKLTASHQQHLLLFPEDAQISLEQDHAINKNDQNNCLGHKNIQQQQFDEVAFKPAETLQERRFLVLGLLIHLLVDQHRESGRVSLPYGSIVKKIHSLIQETSGASFSHELKSITTESHIDQLLCELEDEFYIAPIFDFCAPHSIFGVGGAEHYQTLVGSRNDRSTSHGIRKAREARAAVNASKSDDYQRNIMKEFTVNPWRHAIVDFNSATSSSASSINYRQLLPLALRNYPKDNNINNEDQEQNQKEKESQEISVLSLEESNKIVLDFYFELQKAVDPDAISPSMVLRFRRVDCSGDPIFDDDDDDDNDDHHHQQQQQEGKQSSKSKKFAPLSENDTKNIVIFFQDALQILRRDSSFLKLEKHLCQDLVNFKRWSADTTRHFLDRLISDKKLTRFKSSFGGSMWVGVTGQYKFPAFVGKALCENDSAPAGISLITDIRRILGKSCLLPYSEVMKCLAWLGWINPRILNAIFSESAKRGAVVKVRGGDGNQNYGNGASDDFQLLIAPSIHAKIEYEKRMKHVATRKPTTIPPPAASSLLGNYSNNNFSADAHADSAGAAGALSRSEISNNNNNNNNNNIPIVTNINRRVIPSASSLLANNGNVTLDAAESNVNNAEVFRQQTAIRFFIENAIAHLDGAIARFWRDLDTILPKDGSLMTRAHVFRRMEQEYRWTEKSVRESIFSKLINKDFLVASAFEISGVPHVYRVLPQGNILPSNFKKLSNPITQAQFGSFLTKADAFIRENGISIIQPQLVQPINDDDNNNNNDHHHHNQENNETNNYRGNGRFDRFVSPYLFIKFSTGRQQTFHKELVRIMGTTSSNGHEKGGLMSKLAAQWPDKEARMILFEELMKIHLIYETRVHSTALVHLRSLNREKITLRHQYFLLSRCPMVKENARFLKQNETAVLAETMQALVSHPEATGQPGGRGIRIDLWLAHVETRFPELFEKVSSSTSNNRNFNTNSRDARTNSHNHHNNNNNHQNNANTTNFKGEKIKDKYEILPLLVTRKFLFQGTDDLFLHRDFTTSLSEHCSLLKLDDAEAFPVLGIDNNNNNNKKNAIPSSSTSTTSVSMAGTIPAGQIGMNRRRSRSNETSTSTTTHNINNSSLELPQGWAALAKDTNNLNNRYNPAPSSVTQQQHQQQQFLEPNPGTSAPSSYYYAPYVQQQPQQHQTFHQPPSVANNNNNNNAAAVVPQVFYDEKGNKVVIYAPLIVPPQQLQQVSSQYQYFAPPPPLPPQQQQQAPAAYINNVAQNFVEPPANVFSVPPPQQQQQQMYPISASSNQTLVTGVPAVATELQYDEFFFPTSASSSAFNTAASAAAIQVTSIQQQQKQEIERLRRQKQLQEEEEEKERERKRRELEEAVERRQREIELQKQQQQREEEQRRQRYRLVVVASFAHSPIAFPPPQLIRQGVQIIRPQASRLMFAPPPGVPVLKY